MEFKKYNSIENSYQNKVIEHFLGQFPELLDVKFVAVEKLDGSNIQICISPNDIKIGKRTSWIEEGESFNDIHNVIKKYQDSINAIQKHCIEEGLEIRLFGEIYGKGIQRRIDYGDEKHMSFFDIMINGEYLGYQEFLGLVVKFKLPTPKLYLMSNLQQCLKLNAEDKGEGFVIRPKDKNYYSHTGSRFILKKKSESFSEKMEKKQTTQRQVSPLNLEFRRYINENRVKNVFSKYGEIETSKDIAKYIKYVLEDAKEDFIKDTPNFQDIPKDEYKAVFNVGSSIVMIFLIQLEVKALNSF